MNNKKQFWTLRYALINILYFMSFCTLHQFASRFLLDKGFSNTEIGIIIAAANILSVVCQPYVAGLIDKGGRFTNRNVTMLSSFLIMVGSMLLYFIDDMKLIVAVIFALIYMIQFVYQPVLTALVFEYQKVGCNINYGLSRGLGSAGFAVLSIYMGERVKIYGTSSLTIATVVLMLIMIIIVFFFKKPNNQTKFSDSDNKTESYNKEAVAHNNIFEFVRIYPMYILFLLAVVCLFFGHNMLNDYLYQIIVGLGGTEIQFSRAIALAALLELPTMALMSRIVKKITPARLLILSGVFFLIKVLVMLMANGMAMMYISQAIQMFAYAVFIPASAYYVEEVMQEQDKVKGQAFVTCAITLSGVFSGPVCGFVLDRFGVSTMLIIGAIVSAIGVIIAVKAVGRKSAL